MKKKWCMMCEKEAASQKRTCSPECAEALVWKQRSLDRHRNRSKVPGVYRVTVADWKKILNAYNHCCAYCGVRKEMTIDHVVPLSRGGRHCVANLVPACLRCNLSKGSQTIIEWRMFPMKKAPVDNSKLPPWTVCERMGIRPARKRYKRHQTPIFTQVMEERYNAILIDRMNLTVDHFGVLV